MRTMVRHTTIWWSFLLWLGVTGSLLYLSIRTVHENWAFADHAIRTQAKVLQKFQTVFQGKNGPIYTPFVVYSYEVGSIHVQRQTQIAGAIWTALSPGQTLPIKYLPEAPSDSRIDLPTEDFAFTRQPWKAFEFPFAVFLLGAISFSYLNRQNHLRAKFIREGLSSLGFVISVQELHKMGGTLTYLEFSFKVQTGQKILGRTGALNRAQKAYWKTGMPIRVFYDRANLGRFTVDLSPDRNPAT